MARLPKKPEAGKTRYYLAMSRAKTRATTRCYVSTSGNFSPMLEAVGIQDAYGPAEAVKQHLRQCDTGNQILIIMVVSEVVEDTPGAWVVTFDVQYRTRA